MENKKVDKENKSGGCLILFITVAGIFLLMIVSIYIIEHTPRTVATDSYNNYTLELQAKSSPDFPFGSQDGRIILKSSSKKICRTDFIISNDGKSMDEDNWSVKWENDKVIVTIIGEEQSDEIYTLYYNGEVVKGG